MKAKTTSAFHKLKHRLTPQSTILFLQDSRLPKAYSSIRLSAVGITPSQHYLHLHRSTLEKLATNAFYNKTRRVILTKICNVVCALPALQHVSDLSEQSPVNNLETTMDAILCKTFKLRARWCGFSGWLENRSDV
ncbi:2-dehydropantoate 2-reductase [Penicillium psychrosexuale]|uniref:2-dehydropantoate 2-reductase n=1 Tax=Penicillium psychrosexuale TaxID=1002107 RepID=UPI0025458AB3|nr:2-dehydropantoate 2-reductase [Penicillium psychrosexuale]KAJ5797171.1 2-dehydropantoate 2-reductase [Penicillium psychrosexuale]